jgi:hypothetical protein
MGEKLQKTEKIAKLSKMAAPPMLFYKQNLALSETQLFLINSNNCNER